MDETSRKVKREWEKQIINLKTILGLKRKGLSTYKIAEEYNKRHKPFISHMTAYNVLKNKRRVSFK